MFFALPRCLSPNSIWLLATGVTERLRFHQQLDPGSRFVGDVLKPCHMSHGQKNGPTLQMLASVGVSWFFWAFVCLWTSASLRILNGRNGKIRGVDFSQASLGKDLQLRLVISGLRTKLLAKFHQQNRCLAVDFFLCLWLFLFLFLGTCVPSKKYQNGVRRLFLNLQKDCLSWSVDHVVKLRGTVVPTNTLYVWTCAAYPVYSSQMILWWLKDVSLAILRRLAWPPVS